MLENFSIFDIISLSLILILGIKGIMNGFIRETFGLVGVVGGIFLASRYAQGAGELIKNNLYNFENRASTYLIGFIAVLILFWIFSIFFGAIFSKMLRMSGLGGLDKLAGFIVGSLKIFLVFSILAITLSNIAFIRSRMDKFLNKSFMYPIFLEVGKYIVKLDTSHIVEKVISTKNSDSSKL